MKRLSLFLIFFSPLLLSAQDGFLSGAKSSRGRLISVPNPKVYDNCGIQSITWVMTGATKDRSPSTGVNYVGTRFFNLGNTIITYTATDASGNKGTATFTVKVGDKYDAKFICKTDVSTSLVEITHGQVEVSSYPNPSSNYFNLRIKSGSLEEVEIYVRDLAGKIVYQVKGSPDRSYQFGDKFIPGMYMVEVRQGGESGIHKLIKY